MRQVGWRRGTVEDTKPLVHEQHLVRPCRQRRVTHTAGLIVEMKMHEVERAFELLDQLEKISLGSVNFHRQLIDPPEHGV